MLGVERGASQDDVKKAYRKKARENHPDLNPDDEAAARRMNEVNEAYDRIMNPEKYARERPVGSASSPGGPYGGANPYTGGPYAGGGTQGGAGSGKPDDWIDLDDLFGFGQSTQLSLIHIEMCIRDRAGSARSPPARSNAGCACTCSTKPPHTPPKAP